jgi:elongator complex protein 5
MTRQCDREDHGVSLAAIDHAPSTYQSQNLSELATFNMIDCFSDPYGWSVNPHQASPSHSNINQRMGDAPLSLFASKADGLALLESHLIGDGSRLGGKQVHVFLDGASTLADVYGVEAICQFLCKLRKNPKVASLTFHIHSDLHSEYDVSLLCHNLKCLVTLYQAAQFERNRLSGRIEIMTRRKTSGPKRDLYDYVLHAESGLSLSPVANSKPGTGGNSSLKTGVEPFQTFQQQLPGGMRLELTEPEAAARKHVQLPYEHQGQGSVYSSRDYREYLPETAGGKSTRLGHILYVRDSDSEEPDSDEDPDDDLDI